jgi:hypothetical protein
MMGLMLGLTPWMRGAEAPVIGAGDMFNEVGLYYRAYNNSYNAILNTGSYATANRMGPAGANQFWDFSQGPTDRVWRFDYSSATGVPEAVDFPLATLVEHKTVEGVGEEEWVFFEQVPGVGRKVYGFYSEQFSPGMPSIPFSQAIVDFPDTMAYQNSWQTSFTTVSTFPSLDPELFEDFLLRTTWTSAFTVDAWGVVLLPNLGLVDALRINEEQTLGIEADLGDGWQPIDTQFVRSYYWLSPGRGIVAQMTSLQSSTPPPVNFDTAAAFVRMFETNKEGSSGSTDPQPVDNLRVTVSNGRVLIQWNKAANATSYEVEYSTGGLGPENWQPVGTTAGEYLFDNDGFGHQTRFYRVKSVR